MFKKHFHTYVAGISHHKKNYYSLDLDQREHDVEFVEEPTNKHDPNAVKVVVEGKHIGYIPAKHCQRIKDILHYRNILEKVFITEVEAVNDDEDEYDYINDVHIWYK